jgi:Photosynthetic reaction centre cytochrome C subunit
LIGLIKVFSSDQYLNASRKIPSGRLATSFEKDSFSLKLTAFALSASAAVVAAAIALSSATGSVHAAQQPAAPQPAAQAAAPHVHPPNPTPTNLKVLPKNLTGDQVHEIMHHWEADLGATCGTCHATDPKNIGPNGRPRLNYADDSKPEKATARLMYKMTEEINGQYISKVDSSGDPVTCGTCHRGHLGPQPFKGAEDHDHDHDAPAAPPKQ